MANNKGLILGGIGLGAAILLFLGAKKSVLRLKDLEVAIDSMVINKANTNGSQTDLRLKISVFNPNFFNLKFKSIQAQLYYENNRIANISSFNNNLAAPIIFTGNSTSLIPLRLLIPNVKILSSFVTAIELILGGKRTISLNVKGMLYAENMSIPVDEIIKVDLQ